MPNDIKGSDIMKKTEEINQIIVELYDLILNKEVKERDQESIDTTSRSFLFKTFSDMEI